MRPIFNLSKVQILVKNRLKGKIFSRQNETSLLRVLAIEEIAISRRNSNVLGSKNKKWVENYFFNIKIPILVFS